MTERTVPYITESVDLAAVLHARRAERERQMAERQRREHALALIDRRTYAIYLAGEADLHGHRMRVVITLRDYSAVSYLNILCTCAADGYKREYRFHTVNTLADDLFAAAETLLARIEAAQDSRQADVIWGNDG